MRVIAEEERVLQGGRGKAARRVNPEVVRGGGVSYAANVGS